MRYWPESVKNEQKIVKLAVKSKYYPLSHDLDLGMPSIPIRDEVYLGYC